MKKLTSSFPAKVAAVFLLVASMLLALIFGAVFFGAYVCEFYRVSADMHMSFTAAVQWLLDSNYLNEYEAAFYTHQNYDLMSFVFEARHAAAPLAILGLVLFVLLFIFLMCAAGHRSGREGICLSVFDRIPFDLVFAAGAFAEMLLVAAEAELYYAWGRDDVFLLALFCSGVAVAILLVLLAVAYSFAVRAKAGGIWKNTAVYIVLRWAWKWTVTVLRFAWRCTMAAYRWCDSLYHAVRLEWRVFLAAVGCFIANLFGFMLALDHGTDTLGVFFLGVLWVGIAAVLVFSANQFRKLRKAGEKLAAGELDFKINTDKMYFEYCRMGEDLNSIGVGLSAAVEQRMKSERMKTELITNVSHDIKTPLTSIVNYVDLLQKEHTPEQEAEYLEVLKRQSEKLRRLTVDLVEASKASTGSLPTELVPTSAGELINQAVAEYAEKFALGKLEPIITLPEKPITVLADGRHLWRVLDNLFNNAVKYAQPGTRVYVEARRLDGGAVISVKNISRDRLNVAPEELMERFVRGDESRHTEGSGLGLSIARSLTELMGGKFELSIDGDLFKAEIRLKLIQ